MEFIDSVVLPCNCINECFKDYIRNTYGIEPVEYEFFDFFSEPKGNVVSSEGYGHEQLSERWLDWMKDALEDIVEP